MTGYTKHNAKIAQEFWKKVEEGADPNQLWHESVTFSEAAPDYCMEDKESIKEHDRYCFDYKDIKFTWKPETITIHGREVPKPMTRYPDHMDHYFKPQSRYTCTFETWDEQMPDLEGFSRGIFSTEEDCKAFAEAYCRPWQELVE